MSDAERLADQFYAGPSVRPDGRLWERPRIVVVTAAFAAILALGLLIVSLGADDIPVKSAGIVTAGVIGASAYGLFRGRALAWATLAFVTLIGGLNVLQSAYESAWAGEETAVGFVAATFMTAVVATGLSRRSVRAWCGCFGTGRQRSPPERTARPLIVLAYGTAATSLGVLICLILVMSVALGGRLPPSFTILILGPLLLYGGIGVLRGGHRAWAALGGGLGLIVITALQLTVRSLRNGDADATGYGVLTTLSAAVLAGLYLPRIRAWCGVRWVSLRATATIWSVIVFVVVVWL